MITQTKHTKGEKIREKGLPKYSIKGGICNEKGCLNLCTTLVYDGIWRCNPCAEKKVKMFIDLIPRPV